MCDIPPPNFFSPFAKFAIFSYHSVISNFCNSFEPFSKFCNGFIPSASFFYLTQSAQVEKSRFKSSFTAIRLTLKLNKRFNVISI